MKQTRLSRRVTTLLGALSLAGAGLLSMPAQGGLATDFVNATNAVATNYFLGNVGIGTNNPVFNLDVAGNLRVTGTGTLCSVMIGSNVTVAGSLVVSNGCRSDGMTGPI